MKRKLVDLLEDPRVCPAAGIGVEIADKPKVEYTTGPDSRAYIEGSTTCPELKENGQCGVTHGLVWCVTGRVLPVIHLYPTPEGRDKYGEVVGHIKIHVERPTESKPD